MTTCRFAILEHTTDAGTHHDLLVEDPAAPEAKRGDAPLWAVRIDPPPRDWADLPELDLTPLPPHRRRYLTYEGLISRGRGSVKRVAQGLATVSHWGESEKTLQLPLPHGPLTLTITHAPSGQCTARVAAP